MIMEPGDLITIPPGAPHSFKALDSESASVVAFEIPISQ
jgi:quercetin dioxygenase-like cupin family protein